MRDGTYPCGGPRACESQSLSYCQSTARCIAGRYHGIIIKYFGHETILFGQEDSKIPISLRKGVFQTLWSLALNIGIAVIFYLHPLLSLGKRRAKAGTDQSD